MEFVTSTLNNMLTSLAINCVKSVLLTLLTYPFNALILLLVSLYIFIKFLLNLGAKKQLAKDAQKMKD